MNWRPSTLLLLGACTGGAPRLSLGERVESDEARQFRVGPGACEVRFSPGASGAQLFLVAGARRQRVDRRPNAATERLALDMAAVVRLEVTPGPDGGVWAAELGPVENPRELAELDAAYLAAQEVATPPTEAGLKAAAQALIDGAVRARALGDVTRAGEHEVTAAEFLLRVSDMGGAEAHFKAALDSPVAETRVSAYLGRAFLAQYHGDLERVTEQLALARPLIGSDGVLAARLLLAEATALAERGAHAQALALLPPALETAHRVGDDALAAEVEQAIGWRYRDLGDRARALQHFEAEYEAALRTADGRLEGGALHDLGVIRADFDHDWKAALSLDEKAIAAQRRAGDAAGLAFSLDSAGAMASTLGDEGALAYHAEALALRRGLGTVKGEAVTLTALGSAYTRLNRPAEAIEPLTLAIDLYGRIGDRTRQAFAYFRLGRAQDVAGRFPEALASAERALALSESLRERIASDDRRASYTASVRSFYDLAVSAAAHQAMATGERRWIDRALEASERARARSLLDMLRLIDADRPAGQADLVTRDEALRREAHDAEIELRQRRARGEEPERLAAAERALDLKLGAYELLHAQLQAADPRVASLSSLPTIDTASVGTLVGPGSLVVEYHLVSLYSWAIVIDGARARLFRLPPQAELRREAEAFHQLVSARNTEVPVESAVARAARIASADRAAEETRARLRSALLPFGALLDGKRRLVVVADGPLHLVPWAALVPELPVVSAPSLSVVKAQRELNRAPPTLSLLVLGDPVFDADELRHEGRPAEVAVTSGGERHFNRLPYARAESEAIGSLVPEAQRKVWLGFDASKERLLAGGFGRPRILHIATHGVLDTEHPERSGLVLTRVSREGRPVDGFLSLADVYALRLPVELVTLSGCQTALGAEVRGEGLIGLTRGFLHAGARAVVASLWKVNDHATADLMSAFYEGVLRLGLSYGEALHQAQRKLAAQARYRAPYYWAGFVLSGDSLESVPLLDAFKKR